jgi:hypothetical protein
MNSAANPHEWLKPGARGKQHERVRQTNAPRFSPYQTMFPPYATDFSRERSGARLFQDP